MLTHPTLDQMHQLGLAGMARAFTELEANPQSADLAHAEWLALLLDREATERYDRRLRARLRYARLRHQAAVEDVDYRAARGLDRALFQALTAGRWIEEAQNLIIEGPAGVGKSWLACALGHKACRDNRSVLYQRVPRMFGDLALARGDGRYARQRAFGGVELLILDDWGLEPPTRRPGGQRDREQCSSRKQAQDAGGRPREVRGVEELRSNQIGIATAALGGPLPSPGDAGRQVSHPKLPSAPSQNDSWITALPTAKRLMV